MKDAGRRARIVADMLNMMVADRCPVFVAAGFEPRIKKTRALAALAADLAATGMRTLIVDADYKNPAMHELFGLKNNSGLGDVLFSGASHLNVRKTGLENLFFLPWGAKEFKGGRLPAVWGDLLEFLETKFHCIFINIPPGGTARQTGFLNSGGLLIFVSENKTPYSALDAFLESAKRDRAAVCGFIVI
jgi:Mrp family chromosome partitioning ATPase